MTNQLFYGDNLVVLRESIADESVDLIYLDPPFNSAANYNVLFKSPEGQESQAQIEAFEDTWNWTDEAELAFDEVMQSGNSAVAEMLRAMRSFLGENDMMAYLTMMAVRMLELHRVLKNTGSLYLHCDPTASHYLKILLDAAFGPRMFRNEIIWRRTGSHNSTKRFGPIHDVILFYTKTKATRFYRNTRPYMKGHVEKAFVEENGRYRTNYSGNILTGSETRNGISGKPWNGFDPTAKGRHWALPSKLLDGIEDQFEGLNQHEKFDKLLEMGIITIAEGDEWPRYQRYITEEDGQYLSDIWAYQPYTEGTAYGTDKGIDDDVRWMGSKEGERLGYPTQKPLGLLERILMASSKPGDVVLDPFCGCGTAVHAAQKLERRWIGIDITHLAISLIEKRLSDAFPGIRYEVHGTPKDLAGAQELAAVDKYQFQWWAVSLVSAVPWGGRKKGADSGIDGIIYFKPDGRKTEKAIVSVKGGANISVAMIRELGHVVDREKAKVGILLSITPPTKPMVTEAIKAGFYETPYGKFQKLQILTIEDLFEGKKPHLPWLDTSAFRKAANEDRSMDRQGLLL
ncbi:DNA methyltransferase [Aureimonas mangrovi]|uniref:DNA methyltransferase n=1 Tax=Aureimonas mangrovi TaxID=2758041 RepID=UPI00163D7B0D|nr:DNA methyltransferase [Aureimonas mangrovi]